MTNELAVLDRILARCTENPETGCWEWTGSLTTGGYGQVRATGKHLATHRHVYEALRAEIPAGLQLDHLCRVRACANPWHLDPVTQAENVRRGNAGAYLSAKTHCPQGHEYAGDNLYATPNGRRVCRTCQQAAARKYNGYQGNTPCRDRTHCPLGHPYNAENTYHSPGGGRVCKECRRQRDRVRRSEKG